MDDHFNFYASKRTNEELEERIENRQKYLPETIEASVTELQKRGREFTDEELLVINQDIQAQQENATTQDAGLNLWSNTYKNGIVEDPDAPYFYSKRAIYIFTILFSVVFGSVMLAINCWRIKNKTGALLSILFGIVFLTAQIFITQYANANSHSGPAYLFGFIAAIIINVGLWPKFIGNATFYRARPIWVPLIIAVVFSVLVIWSIIVSQP